MRRRSEILQPLVWFAKLGDGSSCEPAARCHIAQYDKPPQYDEHAPARMRARQPPTHKNPFIPIHETRATANQDTALSLDDIVKRALVWVRTRTGPL